MVETISLRGTVPWPMLLAAASQNPTVAAASLVKMDLTSSALSSCSLSPSARDQQQATSNKQQATIHQQQAN